MSTDWGMVIGVSSLISGFVLDLLAIGLSVHFFVKTKNTESAVNSALAEIKQQTNSLERIASRQLDRLTRAVVQPRPETQEILEAIKNLPKNSLADQPSPKPSTNPAEDREWLIKMQITAYFYASIANILLQTRLPEAIDEADPTIRQLVDRSYSDSMFLDKILNGIAPAELNANPLYPTYHEAATIWKPQVRDTVATYQRHAASNTSS
jgi:hypothetical protein